MIKNKSLTDTYNHSSTDKESNVWMGAQDRLIRWNRITDKTLYVPLRLPDGTNISGIETIRKVNMDEEATYGWALQDSVFLS